MVEYGVCLKAPGCAALILCFLMLTACDFLSPGDERHTLTPTPDSPLDTLPAETASLEPTLEPTPSQALDPNNVWVGVEGAAAKIADVSPEGTINVVDLPLNEDQQASSLAASHDGSHLAYLVLDGDNQQHGIAAWDLGEPNARLVATPLSGYRIIALLLADDGSGLAYTQVADESPLTSADWRIDTVSPDGGDPVLLGSREMLDDSPPLVPIAWPTEDLLVLGPAVSSFEAQRLVSISPSSGIAEEIARAPEAQSIGSPSVSPDGSQVAYLLVDENSQASGAVQIADLQGGPSFTLDAPEGQDIYGLRWHADGQRLLLDLVRPSGDDPGQLDQYWAWASTEQPSTWSQSPPGPGREGLFDYEPYDEGVVYTLLPLDGAWELYLLPDIEGSEAPRVTALDDIAQEYGAPSIVYSPHHTQEKR
jgi:hypothetical protein